MVLHDSFMSVGSATLKKGLHFMKGLNQIMETKESLIFGYASPEGLHSTNAFSFENASDI